MERDRHPGVGRPATTVLDLPGRGRTLVHDVPGPAGAPTLVLLHGTALTSTLNWSGVVDVLRRTHRVVSWDMRGHGNRLRGDFRLEDCADDVAAVARALDLRRVVPVGYSMGGLVAQLVWRRHPDLVSGLVLCATSRNVSGGPWEQSMSLVMPGLVTAARWLPVAGLLGADVIGSGLLDTDCNPADRRWALAEMRRTSLGDALSVVQAVCAFSSHDWIGSVDVPSAVVLTRRDRVVLPHHQVELARAIPGSTTVEVDGGHDVFLAAPRGFGAALSSACRAVHRTASGVA